MNENEIRAVIILLKCYGNLLTLVHSSELGFDRPIDFFYSK